MPLATARALQDLRPLVLGDHALELNQQLILGARALRCLHKEGLDTVASELFDQQDLVRVFAAQSIRRIGKYDLNVTLGSEIAHPLESRPLERGSAKAFVFEYPLPGHLQLVALRELDQRRRLARNGAFLALLLG
jgi:hypothetical protein